MIQYYYHVSLKEIYFSNFDEIKKNSYKTYVTKKYIILYTVQRAIFALQLPLLLEELFRC